MKAKHERTPKGKVLWQLIIDEDLRRKFKARCVEESTTMSDQVEKLIRAWLEKKGQNKTAHRVVTATRQA